MKFIYSSLIFFTILLTTKNTLAQWTKTSGPPGISVNCYLDMDSVLFCGTVEDGVYLSEDHGFSWHRSNIGIEHMDVTQLNFDNTNIYAIAGNSRIFRSVDFGQTWQAVYYSNKFMFPITSGDGSIFVGTTYGLISSVDSGLNWNPVISGIFDTLWLGELCYTNHRLIVSINGELYSSTDTGHTFSPDTNFLNANFRGFFNHGDTVFVFGFSTMYKSVDGGISWNEVQNSTFDGTDGIVEINDTLYAGSASSVHMSADWGQTWTQTISTGIKKPPHTVTCFSKSGSNLLLGYNAIGSYISTNKGQSYQQCDLYDFELDANVISLCNGVNGIYAGIFENGIYFSANAGGNWTKLGSTDPMDTLANAIVRAVLSPDANIILAGTDYFGIYRSVDNGNTWNHISSGFPSGTNGFLFVQSLVQSGDTIVAGTELGIFYSTNLGINWSATNNTSSILNIATSDNVLCGYTNAGEIFRSADHGATWTLVHTAPYCWAIGSNHNGYFYASSDSILISADGGLTWLASQNVVINRMAIHAMNDYAWVAENFSNDYGASFTNENDGLNSPTYWIKCFTNDNNFLYASVNNSGVWRRSYSDYVLNNISGKVFYDRNQNNIFDSTDFPFTNIGVALDPVSVVAFSNSGGNYYFKRINGSYIVSLNMPSGFHLTTDSLSYTINVVDTDFTNLDFGIAPDSLISVNVESNIISRLPRCNTVVPYTLTGTNNGIDPASGVIEFRADSQLVFVSSVPPPTSVVGNNYFWNYSNLSPFTTQNLVVVNFMLPAAGNTINSEVHMYANDSVGNTIQETINYISQNVLCSFDPNEKLVSPTGLTPSPIDSWLNYTIYFQNTGNDTAFIVRIADTLDAALDISTLQVTGSSNPVETEVVNNSVVSFIFNNILLADSNINEDASHGFVSYRIKAKSATPNFTQVTNTAYIYFDFNPPIKTNTTSNLLSDSTVFISENFSVDFNVIVYPNPFNSFLRIKISKKNISESYKVSAFTLDGKLIRNYGKMKTDNLVIETADIDPGIYLLQFENIQTGRKHFAKIVNMK